MHVVSRSVPRCLSEAPGPGAELPRGCLHGT